MFGFVNIYKSELKIKDYNLFGAYYCGLCKSLGKKHNQLVRLGLSYDLTFLALIADSLEDDEPKLKKDGCIKHIGMHTVCYNNKWIDYAADMSILLAFYKLCDDISDDKSIKAYLMRFAYLKAVKRVKNKYPQLSDRIKDNIEALSKLEFEECNSIDMVAHPFASIVEDIFSNASPKLARLGYNIGRFIYIADAYKDIDLDRKSNSYNPFLHNDNDYLNSLSFTERVRGTFNMTLNAIALSYKELNIKKNKAITDNIIYLGLYHATDNLFKEENKNVKSI